MAKGKSIESSGEDEGDFLNPALQCSEDDSEQYYTFSASIIDKLQGMGVGNMPIPEISEEGAAIFGLKPGSYFDGRLPTNIRKLTLDQLSLALELQTTWYDYILQQTMLVDAELAEAKRQKEFMWALVRTKIKDAARVAGKKVSDVLVSDLARIDTRFVRVDASFIEKDTLDTCMQAMLRAAGHNLRTVSREISIRQVKEEAEMRRRGLSQGDRPPSRFASRYEPANPRAGLPGIDDEGEEEQTHEGEADEQEERRSATPSKAKGKFKPKLRIKKR